MNDHVAKKTQRFHLDRRAHKLADEDADASDEDLLPTRLVAVWLGVSTQFLEIGRSKGYGPKFIRIGPRVIQYRRGDVREWLRERTHTSTTEYAESAA